MFYKMKNYNRFSSKTRKLIQQSELFYRKITPFIKNTEKFLRKLEDELIVAEAELIVNKYLNKKKKY